MRAWTSSYPARFIAMATYDQATFDIDLGFNIWTRQTIGMELDIDHFEPSKKVFLARRIDNLLATANRITLTLYWGDSDDAGTYAEIDVDNEDLIDLLDRAGFLS
jgi:hypothetical protein